MKFLDDSYSDMSEVGIVEKPDLSKTDFFQDDAKRKYFCNGTITTSTNDPNQKVFDFNEFSSWCLLGNTLISLKYGAGTVSLYINGKHPPFNSQFNADSNWYWGFCIKLDNDVKNKMCQAQIWNE